jgi:hypothetical protein
VILIAVVFKNGILQQLQEQLKFRGPVAVLGRRLEVLNP